MDGESIKGAIYKLCGLQLASNSQVRLTAGKNFYLPYTVEKMHVFAVFGDKYLRPYGFRD